MNKYFSIIVCFLTILLVSSCRDDDSITDTNVSYTVKVEYPATYNTTIANGIVVKAKNLTTNAVSEATTDANGNAVFQSLPQGSYSISATKTLTKTEAEILTGIGQEITLNGTIAQINITVAGSQVMKLEGGAVGDWVIKEFYYSGAPNSYYFYDGYIEVYNNSTETLYADGLLLGNTKSASGSSTSFYGFITNGLTDAYLGIVLKVPGSGKDHPVDPGKSFVVAIDGINHKSDSNGNANSPVNLGARLADFEVYYSVNPTTPDTDNPTVPNMEIIYSNQPTLFDYIPGVFGSGLVLFKDKDPKNLEQVKEPNVTYNAMYVRVPKEEIIDGVDAVPNANVTPDRKRLPNNIDAGMTTVGTTYTGTSVRRKVKQEVNGRKILLDTNNSTNDFEVNKKPNPKGW